MTEVKCTCSKGCHSSPLEGYIISSKAIIELPRYLEKYNNIFIVSDERTYEAAGKAVEDIIKANGKHARSLILKGEVLPDSKTLGEILIHSHNPYNNSNVFEFSPLPDIILAVG
ncbi:MAG TPA: hypothetical protein PKN28_05350, partial [Clostridiales bacterium]|nr:hypothetical protein [Clostridiales bacterium]